MSARHTHHVDRGWCAHVRRPRAILSDWAFWVIVAYFILAAYVVVPGGLLDSHRQDQAQVRANTLRAKRGCEARKLIVAELARLGHNPHLIVQINALNAKYPQIAPCIVPEP